MVVTVLMFLKNLSIVTFYIVRRVFDNVTDGKLRPRTVTPEGSLNVCSYAYITAYLMQTHDSEIDENGNNPAHRLVTSETNA